VSAGGRAVRVAYLHDHGEISGGETSLLALWEHLDRARFEPILVGVGEGPFAAAARRLGVECVAVEYPRFRGLLAPGGWRSLRSLRSLLRELDAALVHGNTPRTNLAASTMRGAAAPAIIWHQRTLPRHSDWDVERRLGWLADRIICNSAAVAERFGARRRNVVVVHNGVDTDRFRPGNGGAAVRSELGLAEGEVAVGIVGNFSPLKNHELFLAAARRFRDGRSAARFLIVGGEVFAENRARAAELRALATALDLEQTVTFVGRRDDMPRVMDALDVLVAASSIEACSRAVLEAMAAGTPVVAARAGGNPELVEAGASGLLFAPESAEDLAGVLELLIVDSDRRRAMGAAARARAVEHFGIGKQVAAIEAVYTAVLDER